MQEERKNVGPAYLDFEAMNLDKKFARFKALLPNIDYLYRGDAEEIKMSNDGLYLFFCETYFRYD